MAAGMNEWREVSFLGDYLRLVTQAHDRGSSSTWREALDMAESGVSALVAERDEIRESERTEAGADDIGDRLLRSRLAVSTAHTGLFVWQRDSPWRS